jgi:S-DNA-T family DNA segregation ATPase FtsK/SpoIIIE
MTVIYQTHSTPTDAERLAEARRLVLEHRRASISLVQRYMRIGYNAAARLMEELEKEGTVSPMNTTGVRTVVGPNL